MSCSNELSALLEARKRAEADRDSIESQMQELRDKHAAAVDKAKDAKVQIVALQESEQAAYASLCAVRQRDSLRSSALTMGTGNRRHRHRRKTRHRKKQHGRRGGGAAEGSSSTNSSSSGGNSDSDDEDSRGNEDDEDFFGRTTQVEKQQEKLIVSLRQQLQEALSEVAELKKRVQHKTEATADLRVQVVTRQRELSEAKAEASRMRVQRDGLRTMFEKSQRVLKKTLDECMAMRREKKEEKKRKRAEGVEASKDEGGRGAVVQSRHLQQQQQQQQASSTRMRLMEHLGSIRGALQGYMEGAQ